MFPAQEAAFLYFFRVFDLKLLSSLEFLLSQLLIPLATPLPNSDKNCLAKFFRIFQTSFKNTKYTHVNI